MKTKRKTRTKPPALSAKPLREVMTNGDLSDFPEGIPPGFCGVPLPPDLLDAIGVYAAEWTLIHDDRLCHEPWTYFYLRTAVDGIDSKDHECSKNSSPSDHWTGTRHRFWSRDSDPDVQKAHGYSPPDRFNTNGVDRSEPEAWEKGEQALSSFQAFALGIATRQAMQTGFYLALLRYADDLKQVPEAMALLERQKQNVERLAAGGRAAKAVNDRHRADLICRLYKAVRPSFPPGRTGNGEANRAVAERYELRTGQTVTVRTVRDTVKEAELSDPPRRKGKH